MQEDQLFYDVIVIGGGHAGCEAAFASAKMGARTLLLTMNLDTLAKASCNPSIGGTAKGHMVREVDALGGIMGKIADKTGIHFRMLNSSKGPAVQSPRAQIDKALYSLYMKQALEKTPNLFLRQGTVISFVSKNGKIEGVITREKIVFKAKSFVLCSGTFLQGIIHVGHETFEGGRGGEAAVNELSQSLKELGFNLGRLKTGTPARIHARSIDYSLLEEQPSEENIFFSFDEKQHLQKKISCYITYTNEKTKEIILKDLDRSALYSGKIVGRGPRYCPSIEDKMVRFSDKERHQIFLEPEGSYTEEVYVNGLSTSLPFDTQVRFIQSIKGLEQAEVLRHAYAIEYDYLISGQIFASLASKKISNLFFAGQINGTTGYEEAAAQGLMAGINATLLAKNQKPFFLPRSSSYIGVMLDDLISKTLDEPYRIFTSRAEHRLLLRHDNADIRLRKFGYELGLITQEQYEKILEKEKILQEETARLQTLFVPFEEKKSSLAKVLARPEMTYAKLYATFPDRVHDFGEEINQSIAIAIKYEGYLSRQVKEIEKLKNLERIFIPSDFSYDNVLGLRNEAKEKLKRFTPPHLASAALIHGVSIADISVLRVALLKNTISPL